MSSSTPPRTAPSRTTRPVRPGWCAGGSGKAPGTPGSRTRGRMPAPLRPAGGPAGPRGAARVGYLGCADTPAMLAVSDRLPDNLGGHWRAERSSPMTLPVPYPGFLRALDASYDAWVGGVKTRRAWIRTERAGDLSPGAAAAEPRQDRPFLIWLRLDRAVGGGNMLAVTDTLRQAVLDHVQRLLPDREVPDVLHGHRPPGQEGPQARFLALRDVGHRHADGRLLGAVVWLPPQTDPDLVQAVRTAMARLWRTAGGAGTLRPGAFGLRRGAAAVGREPAAVEQASPALGDRHADRA